MNLDILRDAIKRELDKEVELAIPLVVEKVKERMAGIAVTIIEKASIEHFGPRSIKIILEFPDKKL